MWCGDGMEGVVAAGWSGAFGSVYESSGTMMQSSVSWVKRNEWFKR